MKLLISFRGRFTRNAKREAERAVLDELERRTRWRDAHPAQGKMLPQIAEELGVRL